MNIYTLCKCYDRSAASYDHNFKEIQFVKYHSLLSLVNLKDHEILLDLGCGTGLLYEYFQYAHPLSLHIVLNGQKNKHSITDHTISFHGIDISPNMIEAAKSKNVHALQGTISSLPFCNNTFTTVTSFTVIGLTPSITNTTLSETSRVLQKDGTFCMSMLRRDFSNDILDLLEANNFDVQHIMYECGQDTGIIAINKKK